MSRILFIEDEPEIFFIVKKILEKEEYEVIEAETGEEGLKKLREMKPEPDLVLLDIVLPELDGWEVCRIIKSDEKTKHIPVIMLTIRASYEDMVKSFIYSKADDHINKPFKNEELLASIRKFLPE